MMHIGIFAKTFPGALEQCLDQVAAHGIRAVHFNMACAGLPSLPEAIPDKATEEIAEAMGRRGLEMVGISATYNMIHPDERERESGLKALREIGRVAPRMGTRLLTLCTGTRDPYDKWRRHPDNDTRDAWTDLLHSMEHALRVADDYDLLFGIEPEEANVIRDAAAARRFLDELRSPCLKIIIDPANLFDRADRPEIRRRIAEAVDLLAEDLIMAHAKDRTRDGRFRPAGKGDVDFSFFISRLKKAGFDGPLVMHGLAPGEVADSLTFLESLLG